MVYLGTYIGPFGLCTMKLGPYSIRRLRKSTALLILLYKFPSKNNLGLLQEKVILYNGNTDDVLALWCARRER